MVLPFTSTVVSARPPCRFGSGLGRKSPTSHSMPLKTAQPTQLSQWVQAKTGLEAAQRALASAPAGIARQLPFDLAVSAGQRCTEVIHQWLAETFKLDRVDQPRMVLSLDVDGVLEDWMDGFTASSVAGAAALRLLQLGNIAVLL